MSVARKIISAAARVDSWSNAVTGLGGLRDKITGYVFKRQFGYQQNDQLLSDMFAEDDLVAKIAEKPTQHMLRAGWTYDGLADDVVVALGDRFDSLLVYEKLTEALVWESLFGGSALFIGADDGRSVDQPLDLENIKSIRFVTVFERRELTPHRWYADPTEDKFGRPASYHLNFSTVPNSLGTDPKQQQPLPPELAKLKERQLLEIHESRLVVFPGRLIPKTERVRNNGWGGSRVVRSLNAVKIFHANWQAVAHIMQDASQGVFKIKGLMDMIAGGQKDLLMARMELVDMARSVARSLLLDADGEDFERKDTSMAGLPDLLDRTAARAAASADMPVTVLMGISPAGLNATGESDIRNWYDQLEAERTQRVTPRLKYLVSVFLRAKDGPTKGVEPQGWKICWGPLWQMTPEEESTVRSNNATEDSTRIQSGVMTPAQVQAARWTKEGYQYKIDSVDFDAQVEADKLYADLTPKTPGATVPAEDKSNAEPGTEPTR